MTERNVSKVHVHPKWNVYVDEFDADLAILVLSDKVTFTQYIQPICMPGNVVIEGVQGTIVGWGIAKNEITEEIPQYTVTKVLNASYCYKKDPPIIAFTSSNTFCGGDGDGTPNKGDSGGGLFGIYDNSWVQYGIISAVRTNETGNVLKNSFAVYTNINMFKNWITDTAQMNDITLQCHYGSAYFFAKYVFWFIKLLSSIDIHILQI